MSTGTNENASIAQTLFDLLCVGFALERIDARITAQLRRQAEASGFAREIGRLFR